MAMMILVIIFTKSKDKKNLVLLSEVNGRMR